MGTTTITLTASDGTLIATDTGGHVDIAHRDRNGDEVLLDTLLIGPLSEPELADVLAEWVASPPA